MRLSFFKVPGSWFLVPGSRFKVLGSRFWVPAAAAAGIAALTGWSGVPAGAQRPTTRFDVLIAHGRIVDGTGSPWFVGDVGLVGDRIAAVGSLAGAIATTRLDATNLVVAPGFIDLLGQSEFNVLVDNRAASKILQGVTTEVTGEGSSIAPVNDRMITEGAANAQHFGVAQDWRTLGDYSSGSRRVRIPRSTSGRSWAPADCATSSSARTIAARRRRNWTR